MIDKEYTREVRESVRADGSCNHTVFTFEEADWLTNGEDDDLNGETTLLAEEAIERSVGIRVDLATEGAASGVLVRSSGASGQEHNTFTISETGGNDRNLADITMDISSIPKITPQDANVTTKSIDFPSSLRLSTPVDGIRVDEKDNPREATFSNQITSAQILHVWEVPVANIIVGINEEWKIDYAERLVTDVAYLRATDLRQFIAAGGRPPPAINMSPNAVSRYIVTNRPTVDPVMIGYTGNFIGRARVMAKFVMATAGTTRGIGCIPVAHFHMNPAHMSKFNPNNLVGWQVGTSSRESDGRGTGMLTNSATFDEYVNSRQAAAVASANAKLEIASIVLEATMANRAKLTTTVITRDRRVEHSLIIGCDRRAVEVADLVSDSDPKRASAILFNCYNGSITLELSLSVLGACGMCTILASIPHKEINYATLWSGVNSDAGTGYAMSKVNIESCKRNSHFASIIANMETRATSRNVGLVLLMRHIPHIKPTINSAMTIIRLNYSTGHATPVGPTDVGFRGFVRPWKEFMSRMKEGHAPFNQINRYRGAATANSSISSLLEMDTNVLRSFREGYSEKYVKSRVMGSGLRGYWRNYYSSAKKGWQACTFVAITMTNGLIDITTAPSRRYVDDHGEFAGNLAFAAHMAYIELCYSQAMFLAYTWVKVRAGGGVAGVLSSLDGAVADAAEVAKYVKYLRKLVTEDGSRSYELNVELVDRCFTTNGAAKRDLEGCAQYAVTGYGKPGPRLNRKIRRAQDHILALISSCLPRVRSTFQEAMGNDLRACKSSMTAEVAPARATSVIDTEDVTYTIIDPGGIDDGKQSHASVVPVSATGFAEDGDLKVAATPASAVIPDDWEEVAEDAQSDRLDVTTAMAELDINNEGYEFAPDGNFAALADLLYAVGGYIVDTDFDLSQLMEDTADELTTEFFTANAADLTRLESDLKSINISGPELVHATFTREIQGAIHELAIALGVSRSARNILA